MDSAQIEALKESLGGSMTPDQLGVLRDIQAFIDFGIENGLSYLAVVSTIAHDVNGLLTYQDAKWFRPKTAGYTKIMAELGKQMDDMEKENHLHAENE